MKRKLFLTAVAIIIACTSCSSVKEPVYKDATADIEDRVEDLVGRMTLEEKILQLNQYTLGTNTIEQNIGELVSEVPAEIANGERIAQMVFLPFLAAEFIESETLSDTVRGAGGFGSTGKA